MLQSILDRLQPGWVIDYHEHDSLLEHVFSEELSEEERKAAWAEYREQITKYDNATYYNSLQNQLDASVQPTELLSHLVSGSSAGSSMQMVPGFTQSAPPPAHNASELLTVLSNTNRNVLSLVQHLREKESLSGTLANCKQHHVPPSPNLTAMLAENGKNITALYALVEEGVSRVNTTLNMCQSGQLHFEPGVDKLANQLRSRLIKSLDVLRFGSDKKPAAARVNEVGSWGSMSMQQQQHHGATLQQAHRATHASLIQTVALESKASGLNIHQK